MSNPFEFFNASDDEEDQKVIVVKKDDKPKLSISSSTQPMPISEPTRNKKNKIRRRLPRSPSLQPPAKMHLPKIKKATSMLIWRGRRSSGNKRKFPVDILTIDDQEPAESILLVIQGPTQKGWRRIRQCWQHQGHATPIKIWRRQASRR